MDIQLSVDGGDAGLGLEGLEDWLREEPDLGGRITRLERPPAPGEMGALSEAVSVALGSGGALSVLMASLKVFFAQPRGSNLKIRIRTADGAEVIVDAERVRNAERTMREVLGLEP